MPDPDPDITLSASGSDRHSAGVPRRSGKSSRSLHPAEFGARLQTHSRALWCIAVGVTGDRSGAEDLVQEAALVGLSKLDEFDPETSFTAWMGQIVRFIALNDRRRKQRQRQTLMDHAIAEMHGPTPVTPASKPAAVSPSGTLRSDHGHFDDELTRAVRSLDDVARSCLLLRVVCDLSYKEIARTLNIPEGTAMSHVHRSRQTLRQQVSQPQQPGSSDGIKGT